MFKKHKAIIFGVSGLEVLPEEREFFARVKPLGFILFSRNIANKKQVSSLLQDLRKIIDNPHAPIFIDQEGGRVSRLKKPFWYSPPAACVFGQIAHDNLSDAKKALTLNTILISLDLIELGISSDAIPILDILTNTTHNVIGDRAYSSDKHIVASLGKILCETLKKLNIAPIIKHIPGHGRAQADSHLELPIVTASYEELLDIDFYPFMKLNKEKLAMTAHVVYKSIDAKLPATLSKKVISEIRNKIGFKNLLLTDCICMNALSGSMATRSAKALEAGCEIILHSRGTVHEMAAVQKTTPFITESQNQILKSLFAKIVTLADLDKTIFDKIKIKTELNNLLKKHNIDISEHFPSQDPTQQN